MDYLPVITLLFGLTWVWIWWSKRGVKLAKGSLPIAEYVLLHDGNSITLHRAERSKGGSFVIQEAEYPPALARRVDDAVGFPGSLYLIAIEPVALTQHRELERVRFGILTGAIFKPAGDLMEMLRWVAVAVVISVAIFVYMSVSSINSALADQSAQLKKANEVLSKPLVIGGFDNDKK